MTLVEFLLARIDDEEHKRRDDFVASFEEPPDRDEEIGHLYDDSLTGSCSRLGFASDRLLVSLWARVPWMLRYLAEPFHDHPDYNPEWAL